MSQSPDEVTKGIMNPALDKPAQRWRTEGTVPAVSANGFRKLELNLGSNSRIVFQADPNGVAVEQYRLLRYSLAEHFPQGGTLLMTSPTKGDGKTLNAINLAWCLAESSSSTLLAEVDLRQPSVSDVMGFRPMPGIESALAGEVLPEATVCVTSGMPLHVAAVSKSQKDPVRLLKSPAMKNFLEWARSKFRWVVLDGPPVIPAADVPELAPMSDAVLMVVRARYTPRDLVQKSFQIVGQRLRGVIMNEATLCWDSYYRYMGGYPAEK
jgi:Mrp family chromosome partitioning ATPase